MWKKIIYCSMLFLLAAGMTACGGRKEENEVRIGYFNNVTHAQALVMKANGSLEKQLGEEKTVKWTAFNAGPAEVEALFAEDIDIGYIGPVPAVNAYVKSKGEVQILAGATKGGAVLLVRKGSGINNVKDLAGKNVAIPQLGNTQHLSLLNLLNENGLKPLTEGGDVNVCAIANADVANTMKRGDIDAALVPEPWGTILLEEDCELLLDYEQVYMDGNYDVAVVVVRKEFMEKYPEVVDAFLKTHEEITKEIQEDFETCLSVMDQELEQATGKALGDAVIQEAFSRIQLDTRYNKDAILGFARIGKEQGFISEIPDDSIFAK